MTSRTAAVPTLASYRVWCEAMAADLLATHGDVVSGVLDPVWDDVALLPHEAALVGAPLLGRLARVRQLAVVHLLHPRATHTRLDHSIGVMHALDLAAGATSPELRSAVRLAGLCHDLGHGALGHVGEAALSATPFVSGLLRQYAAETGRARPLAEMTAHLLVTSEAFRDVVRRTHPDGSRTADRVHATMLEVLGFAPPRYAAAAEAAALLDGTTDADKVDYLLRDSQACERYVPDALADLPKHLVEWDRSGPSPLLAPDVQRAVASARRSMFEDVYWHPTARVVASMLTDAITASPITSPEDLDAVMRLDDDAFVELLAGFTPGLPRSLSRGAWHDILKTARTRPLRAGERASPRGRIAWSPARTKNVGLDVEDVPDLLVSLGEP